MNSRATMFLNNVTVVDHAWIDSEGDIHGGSIYPSFLIEGPVTDHESVVVDFSTIKKQLKSLIDDKRLGFDHKLWILQGYSNYKLEKNGDLEFVLTTDKLKITSPIDAFKTFSAADYSMLEIARAFDKYLNAHFQDIGVKITTFISESMDSFGGFPYNTFRYVHGLKNSSSWGCQNIAHGHFSFIQAFDKDMNYLSDVSDKLASIYKDSIFIFKENILEERETTYLLDYTTARGHFSMEIGKEKCRVLTTETTIEFLIQDMVKQIQNSQLHYLFVSEGLSKGAFFNVDQTQPLQAEML